MAEAPFLAEEVIQSFEVAGTCGGTYTRCQQAFKARWLDAVMAVIHKTKDVELFGPAQHLFLESCYVVYPVSVMLQGKCIQWCELKIFFVIIKAVTVIEQVFEFFIIIDFEIIIFFFST